MNKIGVFGDSFAASGKAVTRWGKRIYINNSKSWMTLIGAKSYGYGGTDVAYSFLEFEKHHSKYDQVIFVLTEPHRMTLEDGENNIVTYCGPGTPSLLNAKIANKHNLFELRDIWNTLANMEPSLYINSSYRKRNCLHYNLVIERIKQIRPDVKFIPASTTLYAPSLCDIVFLEEEIMKWKGINDKDDSRIAHLTEESHIILTRLIKEWLKTDEMFFDFDIKEFENIKPERNIYDMSRWPNE